MMIDVNSNSYNGLTIDEYLAHHGHKEISKLLRYAEKTKSRQTIYLIKKELRKHQKYLKALITAVYIFQDNGIEFISTAEFAELLKDYLRIKEFLSSRPKHTF